MSRRRDIIRVAARLFRESGYPSTSIRDIGEAVGVTSAALYYHFENKGEILCEVMCEGVRRVHETVQAAMDPQEHADERIRAGLRAHLIASLEHQDFAAVMMRERRALSEAHRRRVIEARDAYEALWAEVLEDAERRGLLKPQVDARLLRLIGMGAMNWAIIWYRPGGVYTPTEIADAFLEMIMDGVFAGPREEEERRDDSRAGTVEA